MSRINPIKPKNPWEKVKIFYDKINFYQEIKIFSHRQVFLFLFYEAFVFYSQSLANLAEKFPPISASCISKLSHFLTVSGCRPAISLSEMHSYQPSQQQYFIERPQNLTVIEGESVVLRSVLVQESPLRVSSPFPGVRSGTWPGRSSGRLTGSPWGTIWKPSGATALSVHQGGTFPMVGLLVS